MGGRRFCKECSSPQNDAVSVDISFKRGSFHPKDRIVAHIARLRADIERGRQAEAELAEIRKLLDGGPLLVRFSNPLDGGPPHDDRPRALWQREGDASRRSRWGRAFSASAGRSTVEDHLDRAIKAARHRHARMTPTCSSVYVSCKPRRRATSRNEAGRSKTAWRRTSPRADARPSSPSASRDSYTDRPI
jgi:hypothetical protein